jgi:UPF0755 protein
VTNAPDSKPLLAKPPLVKPPQASPAQVKLAPAKPPTPRPKRTGLWLFMLLATGLLVGAAAGLSVVLPSPAGNKQIIFIPRDAGLLGIGRVLAEKSILYHPWQFAVPAKWLARGNLHTGEYEIPPHLSVLDMIALFRAGKTILHKVVVPEGLSNAEIIQLLQQEPLLTEPLGVIPAEGQLYPATYFFSRDDSRASIINQMKKTASEILQREWQGRTANLPLTTPEQALVLASLIEKETGIANERDIISGVFMNRLRLGMRLQSDPTVRYGVAQQEGKPLKGALTSADLVMPTPYNTYVITGLPPAPIANPGRAALHAALHPAAHNYLYFVANGSGGHAFAASLAEHNRNVSQWRKLGK